MAALAEIVKSLARDQQLVFCECFDDDASAPEEHLALAVRLQSCPPLQQRRQFRAGSRADSFGGGGVNETSEGFGLWLAE